MKKPKAEAVYTKARTKLTNKEIANDVVEHLLNFASTCNHTKLQLKPIVDLSTGEMEQPQDRMKLWLTSVLDEHRPEPYQPSRAKTKKGE